MLGFVLNLSSLICVTGALPEADRLRHPLLHVRAAQGERNYLQLLH